MISADFRDRDIDDATADKCGCGGCAIVVRAVKMHSI